MFRWLYKIHTEYVLKLFGIDKWERDEGQREGVSNSSPLQEQLKSMSVPAGSAASQGLLDKLQSMELRLASIESAMTDFSKDAKKIKVLARKLTYFKWD